MRVYVASSWRNTHQAEIVTRLRDAGHCVYDFKNPRPGNHGFHWSDVDPNWRSWTPEQYVAGLKDPIARVGFSSDDQALHYAEACVLVLPSGRSAHLEAGVAVGMGKPLVIYLPKGEAFEPELMYSWADCITDDMHSVVVAIEAAERAVHGVVDPTYPFRALRKRGHTA